MNIIDLKKMEVSVGYGSNSFTMTRGSFNYKKKIKQKHALKLVGESKISDLESLLTYKDARTNRLFVFSFTEESVGARANIKLITDTSDYGINRYWITFPAYDTEHFYGCGETFSKFDLNGQCVRIWTAEHQNANRISKKIIRDKLTGKHPDKVLSFDKYESYYVQPTFVSSHGYYIHVDGRGYMEFDFSKDNKTTLYMQEKPDIYFEAADTFENLSYKLSNLLGRQRMLPDWVYDGVILASQEGISSIEKKIELARQSGIPLTGFWCQDWCGCRRTGFGYQVMWNWEYDKELYPDLDKKIAAWKKEGIHFLGYINPFMALEKDLYAYASPKGYCVKNKEGEDYLVTITTFPAAMIDLTNPDAYEWYKDIIKKNMIDMGLSGWMADFGEYLPTDCVLFDGSDPELRHNEWPAIWAKLNYEALAERGMEKELFFFTRAGFTETIKYSPVMWNGDQHVDFSVDDGLPSVIPATLSLAMSGFGITHSDIGGYTTIMNMTRNKNLLMRWEEMNIFSPIMRFHEGNQPSRNVQFDADDELTSHLAFCVTIHTRLKEYLKHCVKQAVDKGTPVMRPIFYHCDEDWAFTEKTEYFLGEDLLVAPVIQENAVKRIVRLPEGKWIHFFTKEEYDEGVYEIDAPIGKIPVFIRKNSAFFDMLSAIY